MSLLINIDQPSKAFEKHITNSYNKRIIFSGIFGIGKSYFLKEYFDKQKDNYLVIRLSPVNYSISSNEDIFQLIKYDILYEIFFTHKYQFEQLNFSKSLVYSTLIANKLPSIIRDLLKKVYSLNKEANPKIEAFIDIANYIRIEAEKISMKAKTLQQDPDYDKISGWIGIVENGFTLELDYFSEFIKDALNKLVEVDEETQESKAREKVLIIDDLDRIDPEHIFRLFNIFSSHFEYRHDEAENKFGFDRVIFVCDINNIRNIFSARYGFNTDFNGYIDKFYSTEIFCFKNHIAIHNQIEKIINALEIPQKLNSIKRSLQSSLAISVLETMVLAEAINLRTFKRRAEQNNHPFEEREYILKGTSHKIANWTVELLLVFELLEWYFGDPRAVLDALNKARNYVTTDSLVLNDSNRLSYKQFIGKVLVYLDASKHKFIRLADNQTHLYQLDDCKIEYQLLETGTTMDEYFADVKNISNSRTSDINVFYNLLCMAYKAHCS